MQSSVASNRWRYIRLEWVDMFGLATEWVLAFLMYVASMLSINSDGRPDMDPDNDWLTWIPAGPAHDYAHAFGVWLASAPADVLPYLVEAVRALVGLFFLAF